MLKQENLAANFCGLLAQKGYKDQANEFKILGQEKNGTLLASWISKEIESNQDISMIGSYNAKEKSFEIVYKFSSRQNIIQASINVSRSLLLYVIKEQICTDNCETDESSDIKYVYRAFLAELKNKDEAPKELLETARSKQVLAQFLWYKQQRNSQDRFLLMIHEECIFLYTLVLKRNPTSNEENWYYDKTSIKIETIVKNFIWCQWESKIQSLFYIHLKQTTRISLEKEEDDKVISPTLSAFQFHDDLPTETVLNIPLNLPKMPMSSKISEYEDDTIPLRIHDSTLNLIIVTDDDFGIFICHYYLYQPIKQQEENQSSVGDVHFAYSVTMVHCSLVVHCIIPGIAWEKAKLMKPTFTLIDEYMLVFQADLFINLLDIGLEHEPCGHIVAEPFTRQPVTHLVPCFNSISYDSATLDLISLQIPKNHLIDTFKNDTSIDNRINILHYFLVHKNDFDIFAELLNIIMEQPLNLDTVSLLKEALVGGTYSTLKKGLSQDALALLKLLPLTTANTTKPIQAKVFDLTVGLSHEFLHNTPMMLLSPQQRLSPYRQDIWTRLHDRLQENKDCKKRFCCDQVTEKLMYSLACYQPEALSRCTTPQTPSSSNQIMMSELSSINSFSSSKRTQNDMLPFIEFETCTASKQEHVISVNLRELSMHLVKHSVKQITGFRWLKDYEPTAPSFVHAVSTKYVTAQLEISRLLCVLVCRAAGIDSRIETDRGFHLIDKLSMPQRYLLFLMLERYVLSVESMSFPLPQGFSSFFTYLGFKSLEFEQFIEYSQRHVFELQIDVMKIIINDIKDTDEGIARKLTLLALLPRTRARRLLNNWNHPISLRIRSMEHATNVLSGNSAGRSMSLSSSRNSNSIGNVSSYQSPYLNTLLELLTGKCSLNEIDFNLLIEATQATMEYDKNN
ncbi:hypothetical protein PVAND_005092 [Polypedilum vanderplanki]|uniref:Gamma-secretase-activating protein C-terminal domain-containing protein n=1 Tax=Polypedilum vanderplanki TaxID=319348 RepID=A0A9J6BZB0_POLVA|nr:hypothetical protein PVAND_005092 [Polypedilum vanderplanki]